MQLLWRSSSAGREGSDKKTGKADKYNRQQCLTWGKLTIVQNVMDDQRNAAHSTDTLNIG